MPSSTSTLTAVPASRNDEIVAILRDEILRGQYRAGERLPSERDLAARFSTGRGSVREALKKLEQLGIASIQRGGARVVPIEHCTLDVLAPLLNLEPIPDPVLVDQVLEMFGVLMNVAARDGLSKASPAQWDRFERLAENMLEADPSHARRHQALRELGEFLIEIADHLVLRLMMNGLRTSFLARMQRIQIKSELESSIYKEIVIDLHQAAKTRDIERVCEVMRRINRFFRDNINAALTTRNQSRISA